MAVIWARRPAGWRSRYESVNPTVLARRMPKGCLAWWFNGRHTSVGIGQWWLLGKIELNLLLGIVRGIDEAQVGDFHQAGTAVGITLDTPADLHLMVEPL